jgi:hypothetical protein
MNPPIFPQRHMASAMAQYDAHASQTVQPVQSLQVHWVAAAMAAFLAHAARLAVSAVKQGFAEGIRALLQHRLWVAWRSLRVSLADLASEYRPLDVKIFT